MTPENHDKTAPNGKVISFILLDGRVWFSQASLASLFYWDEHNWLMELAREFDAQRTEFRVVPVKERNFRELIEPMLHGIVKVECQYAVGMYSIDFYLPELGVAIQYDESHHARPQRMVADKNREKSIRQSMPNIQFIRVQEQQEDRAGGQVDVARLEHAAGVTAIRIALSQSLERGFLVAKGFEKPVGKLRRIERGFGELGDSLFDLDGVHGAGCGHSQEGGRTGV